MTLLAPQTEWMVSVEAPLGFQWMASKEGPMGFVSLHFVEEHENRENDHKSFFFSLKRTRLSSSIFLTANIAVADPFGDEWGGKMRCNPPPYPFEKLNQGQSLFLLTGGSRIFPPKNWMKLRTLGPRPQTPNSLCMLGPTQSPYPYQKEC